MILAILYVVVILLSTLLGALSGLGGGVIIKPVLDSIGYHDITTISFISTTAVFTMAMYAVSRHLHNGIKVDWKLTVFIALGSLVGGYIGNYAFTVCMATFNDRYVQIGQTSLLILLLVGTLVSVDKTLSKPMKQGWSYGFIGILLGTLSSFLGIGGGPFNVTLFTWLFHIPLKLAAIYSLVTILFSQGAKLITIAMTSGFFTYDISLLYYCLPAALIGGIIGSKLHKKLTDIQIKKLFKITVIGIIILNFIILIRNMN